MSRREIVFDTETTGFDPRRGDRLIEIGCLELINHVPTGRQYHQYVNPERDVPDDAVKVHGLTAEFLAPYPVFADIVDDFLTFIGDSPLIAHNASFDFGFINAELERCGLGKIHPDRAIDTVAMARRKFPGAPASLDALCKRFGIDNSNRQLHGALLDSLLLAEVYLELIGGRQVGLGLDADAGGDAGIASGPTPAFARSGRIPRVIAPSADELAAHEAFINKMKAAPIWRAE